MITHAREQKEMSRYRLARETGIDQSTLWRYEKRNVTPGLKNLIKIAQHLGVTIEEVIK